MNNLTFKVGDYVRHKNPAVNDGLRMEIKETRKGRFGEDQYLCDHSNQGGIEQRNWFTSDEVEFAGEADEPPQFVNG